METKTTNKVSISYLTKKESTFLLGKLKFVECTACPDFYDGCKGNLPQTEIASMPDEQYLQTHTRGTEKYLCGKLRNILNLTAAQEQEIAMQFEKEFNEKVSMLSRRGDKYILIHDVDEFENVANGIRRSIMREFESRAEKVNQKNQESFAELEQRLEYMNGKIIEQDEIIKRLKKERKEIK
jgi:hypothetical protein